MGELTDTMRLGPFPAPGDKLVMITLHPDGRLGVRAKGLTTQQDIAAFLRAAADDIAAGSSRAGLILPPV